MSELFAPSTDALIIYSLMFPRDPGDERPGPASGETARLPLAEGRCPSCVALRDQLDGVTSGRSNRSGTSSTSRARAGPDRDEQLSYDD
jgi:predicted dithiol-disulfide oxidoreductase (DUF899 family)